MAADKSTEHEPCRFLLLIDPPGCDYDRSSSALMVALRALTQLLLNADDWDRHSSRDNMVAMLQSAGNSLLLITDQFEARINQSGQLEETVGKLLAEAAELTRQALEPG